ncbi:CHASE domain-containing protein [Candidatus Magnetominusculus dajiuhuensis]|uniref:CHASE domain-containing protein n=1 Tax=Candidatus Magnetominusculus dajiuhuensis TaxID=3137712 RepID=UPI003B42CF71
MQRISKLWITVIVLVSAAVSCVVYYAIAANIDAGNFELFKRAVDDHAAVIEGELDNNFDQVYDLARLFDSVEDVTADNFSSFMKDIFEKHPSFYAFEWLPRVEYSKKTEFELTARKKAILPDYYIFEKSGDKNIPVLARDEYFPVYYRQSRARRDFRVEGFDLASEAVRRKIIEKACDTGAITVSEPIVLISEVEKGVKAIMALMPVYHGNPKTLQARRANLRGFTVGLFRVKNIFEESFRRKDSLYKSTVFDIQIQGLPQDKRMLYRHVPSGIVEHSKLNYVKTIEVAGLTLNIKAVPAMSYFSERRGLAALFGAAGVFTIVSLLGGFIVSIKTYNAQMEIEVAEKTMYLLESEKKYRQLVDLSREGIWAVDKDNRTTFVNQAMADMLGYTADDMAGVSFFDFIGQESDINGQHSLKYQTQPWEKDRMEVILMRKDGKEITAAVSMVCITDESGRYAGSVSAISDITRRKEMDDKLKKSLAEKDILLKEVHHRVKNNLQIVSGMLGMQMDYVSDSRYYGMFEDCQRRIQAIAHVHEQIYLSEGFTNINMREYVTQLTDGYFRNFTIHNKSVAVKIAIDNIDLGIDIAIPCGLIINELVTNILKHAFPAESVCMENEQCHVDIAIHSLDEKIDKAAPEEKLSQSEMIPPYAQMLELIISDNGAGFPEAVDFKNSKGLGMQIVNILVEQLEGTIWLDSSAQGSKFSINFENKRTV